MCNVENDFECRVIKNQIKAFKDRLKELKNNNIDGKYLQEIKNEIKNQIFNLELELERNRKN